MFLDAMTKRGNKSEVVCDNQNIPKTHHPVMLDLQKTRMLNFDILMMPYVP